jgi:hypothetical protein
MVLVYYQLKGENKMATPNRQAMVELHEKVSVAASFTDVWTVDPLAPYLDKFNLRLKNLGYFESRVYKKVVTFTSSKYSGVGKENFSLNLNDSAEEMAKTLNNFAEGLLAQQRRRQEEANTKKTAINNAVDCLKTVNPNIVPDSDNGFRLDVTEGRSYATRKAEGKFSYRQENIEKMSLYELTFEQAKKILAIMAED